MAGDGPRSFRDSATYSLSFALASCIATSFIRSLLAAGSRIIARPHEADWLWPPEGERFRRGARYFPAGGAPPPPSPGRGRPSGSGGHSVNGVARRAASG